MIGFQISLYFKLNSCFHSSYGIQHHCQNQFYCSVRNQRSRLNSNSENINANNSNTDDSVSVPISPVETLDPVQLKSLREQIELLELSLDAAVHTEKFQEAAALRDKLVDLKRKDPYFVLTEQLENAVKAEDYSVAAQLRDKLRSVQPPSPPPSLSDLDSGKNSSGVTGFDLVKDYPTALRSVLRTSRAETDGVVVEVSSEYLPDKSKPEKMYYVFGYKVRITNEKCSKGMIQLVRRHWKILDLTGRKVDVEGAGVVGSQPVLDVGESFEYSSMLPVTVSFDKEPAILEETWKKFKQANSALASMSGTFTMMCGPLANKPFEVKINPVGFFLPKEV